MRHVLLALALTGCGAAQITASEVVTTACEHTYGAIAEEREAGDSTYDEARLKLEGAGLVCLAIHTAIEQSAENDQ